MTLVTAHCRKNTSVQFSCSVVSDSLGFHGMQHARLLYPSSSPEACSNSHLLSQGGHPTSLSSVIPFSSCLQSFPASGSFQMSQFFTSGGQSFGSISFSISPSIEYSGLISFRMDWLDLVVQGTLKSLLQHHSSKASILQCSAFFMVPLSHPYMTTGKTIALTRQLIKKQRHHFANKSPSSQSYGFSSSQVWIWVGL